MKKIHILENALRCLLDEGRNAEKAKQKTIAVMKSYLSQNGIQGGQLEAMTLEYEDNFKDWLFHANMPDSIIRLEPIMANVAMQLGFTPQNKDTRELYRLQDITNYIIANYQNENFPITLNKLTLNNTSFEKLNELFGSAIDDNDSVTSIDNKSKHHYTVKRLNTFREAQKYYHYTQRICYLEEKKTWDYYTDNGKNTVYVLLRDGWQNIPAKHGENTPYDDYGKSMVFVIIRPDGKVAYTNTRWNHNTDGKGPRNVDQSFKWKMDEISSILQTDYRNVLKPYTEVSALSLPMLRKWISEGKDVLKLCNNVEKVSDNLYQIYLSDVRFVLYNLHMNKLMPSDDIILCFIGIFYHGYNSIKRDDGKWTFIDTDGQQIGDWYKRIEDFRENFAIVEREDEKVSFINTQGKQICDWYKNVWHFEHGFAKVQRDDGKWSYINTEGQQICDWYKNILPFYNGYAKVQRNDGKLSFINKHGEQIGDWYLDAKDFRDGVAIVQRDDGNWVFIDTQGKQIGDLIKRMQILYGNYKIQREDNKWALINNHWEILIDWCEEISIHSFIPPLILCKRSNGEYALFNQQGKQISEWYSDIYPFVEGFAKVTRSDKKYAFINVMGQQIGGWFDRVKYFKKGLAQVKLHKTWYYMDTKGNLYDYDTKQPISVQNESYMRLNDLIIEALHASIKKYLLYN